MTTETEQKADFLVWSNQHGAWWRPNGQGYTTRLEDAGRYTEERADAACKSGGTFEGAPPEEIKVRAPEYEYLRHRDPLAAVKLRHGYSGSEWVKLQLGYRQEREAAKKHKEDWKPVPYTMSPFGEVVADILGYVFRGIYHMDHKQLEKVDWSRNWVEVKLHRGHDLATFDGQELTELVIMCHDHAIRFSVHAEFGAYLKLGFSQRTREGDIYDRHPTIEHAIKRVRSVEQ